MIDRLPRRPSSSDVSDALDSAGFFAGNATASVLAAELLHLRECIERCKSLQRVNEEAAKEWERDAGLAEDDRVARWSRYRALIYREVASELAKATEGF